jgi:pyruvate-formate lyase
MDSRLDRYLDQPNGDHAEYVETTPQDERTYLEREIRHIEKLLNSEDADTGLVTCFEWYDRLTECKSRLRALLAQEMTVLQSTSQLHCEGLIKIHLRQLELESQIRALEVSQ